MNLIESEQLAANEYVFSTVALEGCSIPLVELTRKNVAKVEAIQQNDLSYIR